MSDAIKPCPFCGAEPDSGNVGDHFVECPCCGTEGPYGFLPGAESAIEAWNTRAALAEVAMLRTGDTCARHCEGTAYRIEAQNLKRTIAAQTAKITRLCDQLAASEARAIELDAMLEHCRDEAAETERMLRAEYVNTESRAEETRRLYDELLYQVSMKYPGESRHQTALRYLQLAETHVSGPAFASLRGEVTP